MAGVSYRDLQKADYESIIQLINITWEFEQFISGAKTLHRIIHLLLMGSLLTSSYGKVAIMDGHVVGFILGRAEKDKKRLLKKTQLITLLIPYISVIFASKSDKKNISEYLKIPKTYKELMKGKTFNGEIVFFAVSQNCRGLGIGRQLTDDVKHYFKEMSAYAVSVFTDTNCNYGFYDSQGFGLVESKEIELNIVPSPKNLTIFLYALNVVTTTQ